MSNVFEKYQEPERQASLDLNCNSAVVLDFKYDSEKGALLDLYEKGKKAQWDAEKVLDWSIPVDPDNPLSYDDIFLPVYGTPLWSNSNSHEQAEIRHHYQAYTLSQFLHGEQAALVAAGRLIQVLPCALGKQFAAQQAADEARHIEVFRRIVADKIGTAYQMDPGVSEFFSIGLSDPRWDFAMLTSQILIEGLALGLLQRLRDFSRNKLIKSAAMYIMADEARHVAYGLDELGEYYSHLSSYELRERADFARDGLNTLQKRLNPAAVWKHLGLSDAVPRDGVAMQGFDRAVNRLSLRMEAMLEKLRLKEAKGGVEASVRLNTWEIADSRIFGQI